MQGKHAEAKLELSKICLVLRIFPPEESAVSAIVYPCNFMEVSLCKFIKKIIENGHLFSLSILFMLDIAFFYKKLGFSDC